MPPSWTNLGTSGVHFCASVAKPARHGSRKAPRPPKTPSRPRFLSFLMIFGMTFWHIFGHVVFKMCSTIFLANLQCCQCQKNLHPDFSLHVCRSCPITLPRYADLDSSSTIVKTRGAGGDSRSVFNNNSNNICHGLGKATATTHDFCKGNIRLWEILDYEK